MNPAAIPIYEFDASRSRFSFAWRDFTQAFSNPSLIATLVRQDIDNRFKGSLLGGFWITVTTLATVSGLAMLYGQIFGVGLNDYFPYVAIGIVVWGLMSSLINDGVAAFAGGAAMISQTALPRTLLAIRATCRGLWSLAFKLPVVIGVIIFTHVAQGVGGVMLSLAGIALIVLSGFFLTFALGTIAARFRDIGQLADVTLTFSFFATPVFWHADRLGPYQHLVAFNPFYHFLNVVRGPLIGADDLALSFGVAGALTVLCAILGALVYGFFARRLPYWV